MLFRTVVPQRARTSQSVGRRTKVTTCNMISPHGWLRSTQEMNALPIVYDCTNSFSTTVPVYCVHLFGSEINRWHLQKNVMHESLFSPRRHWHALKFACDCVHCCSASIKAMIIEKLVIDTSSVAVCPSQPLGLRAEKTPVNGSLPQQLRGPGYNSNTPNPGYIY